MPDLAVPSLDGSSFGGYIALPQKSCAPGLMVIQEIFGVDPGLRALCDSFAEQGYVTVCPDLFWRQSPGLVLGDSSSDDWDRMSDLYKNFDVEAGVRDLLATLAYLRRRPECNGKVGAVGYCLGSRLAWLLAARSDVDCAVGYYGVGIEGCLDEIHDIRAPMLLHLAERDRFMASAARQKIMTSTVRHPVITVHAYPDAEHGFARPQTQNYRADAAALANMRTQNFLESALKGL